MARVRELSGRQGAGSGGDDGEGEGEGPKVPLSDAQEFAFLDPRLGNPMSRELLQQEVGEYKSEAVAADKNAAVERWKLARRVRRLYDGFAERTKGYPTFKAFAKAELGLERQRVEELLLISLVPNEESARRYGISKMPVGAELLELTGLRTWKALEKRPLEVKLADPVFFPEATVSQLELARDVLKKEQAGHEPEVPAGLRKAARDGNRVLTPHLEALPALQDRGIRFIARPGSKESELRIAKPLGRDARRELLELLQKLEREDAKTPKKRPVRRTSGAGPDFE